MNRFLLRYSPGTSGSSTEESSSSAVSCQEHSFRLGLPVAKLWRSRSSSSRLGEDIVLLDGVVVECCRLAGIAERAGIISVLTIQYMIYLCEMLRRRVCTLKQRSHFDHILDGAI